MKTKGEQIRSHINHPVIDSDGHLFECHELLVDYLKSEGGSNTGEGLTKGLTGTFMGVDWYQMTPQQRRERRELRPGFFSVPTKQTESLASTIMPRLLYERMDQIGLDYTVLYPGLGLTAFGFRDDEIRRLTCRALNRMYSDLYREYADVMTPVGVIPMHTPAEAIEELEFAVNKLGLKAFVMPSYVRRPITAAVREYPGAERYATWLDPYGVDSEYDYDPVWAKCTELGVAATFHSVGMGWGAHASTCSYIYNHIGHFAAAGELICKALFLGGVTRRFPMLKFAFLEGGVGWARSLLAGLVSHWQKRNIKNLGTLDPKNLDVKDFAQLLKDYGDPRIAGLSRNLTMADISRRLLPAAFKSFDLDMPPNDYSALDEWADCKIERKEDIALLFDNFFFGCEADDPVTSSAFDPARNPLKVRLKAIFGSDIGHWDVPDMFKVLEEAYEPVEEGLITEEDFKDFVFDNPVRLWAAGNPEFFKGTRVEGAVKQTLAA